MHGQQNDDNLTLTQSILESISDGVFTVDLDGRITSFNRAAEEITGVKRENAVGRRCADVFRSNMCGSDCALQQTMKTLKPIIGMTGYIIKVDGNRVPISVSTAVLKNSSGKVIGGAETFRDLSEVEALRRKLQGRIGDGDMLSRSPLMRKIFDVLPAIAMSPSTVLISGDTGTGKELMARTIHGLSPRRKGPFIAVNCGALPDNLLESELFGYKAGAFTGANRDKPGRFSLAGGGTIFLDEIGDISPAFQIRLLRVLQEKTYEPLGATSVEHADVRVIVATNKDLSEMMRSGRFREDLYYRINIVRVVLPPLKKRKEDIPLLVEHFITHFNRLQGKSIQGIAIEVLSLFMAYDWPGNVRELENVIERAFILRRQGLIQLQDLPEELTNSGLNSTRNIDLHSARDLIDAQIIHLALARNDYNRVATARDLGIHKTTLFRRIKKLGISLPPRRKESIRP